jgi:hypothetical protein
VGRLYLPEGRRWKLYSQTDNGIESGALDNNDGECWQN